jgi:hypothetical protein
MSQSAPKRLEQTSAGSLLVFPIRIHTNLKAETIDDLELKKKAMHLSAFKFRIQELRCSLRHAAVQSARAKDEKLQDDGLDRFIDSIVCKVLAPVSA